MTDVVREQTIKFYSEIWDKHDKSIVAEVLHEDVVFRGSLGDEKKGIGGFCEYMDKVHHALKDYRCHIEELVCENGKAFAKMRFSGIHQNEFLGYAPTSKPVSWHGCALFTFRQHKISEVWVLGDLKSLEQQLQEDQKAG